MKTCPVLLTTDFKPMNGGIAEYLHNLWHQMSLHCDTTVFSTVSEEGKDWEHGYRLKVLCPLPDRRLGQRHGDSIWLLRKIHTALFFNQLRSYARHLIKEVLCAKPESVVTIGLWSMFSHFWCEELRKKRIPYILVSHGAEIISPLYGRLPQWRQSDYRSAQAVITNSKGTADLVRKTLNYEGIIEVVHPGIPSFADRDQITEAKSKLEAAETFRNRRIVLSVGRLVSRKGIDLALEAISMLYQEFPDVLYVVAGDGPERERLEGLCRKMNISSHVLFLGEVEDRRRDALYELCDIFLLPNRDLNGCDWEGFGIVFLEAARAGKPCIGGRNGGVADAIEEGVTGFLVHTANSRPVYEALHQLLQNPALGKKMGALGQERVKLHFDWGLSAKKLLKTVYSLG
jgi:phosphatidyl-myo-inositol dimannoside synthase